MNTNYPYQLFYVYGFAAKIKQDISKVQIEHFGKVIPLEFFVIAEERIGNDFTAGKPNQQV
jgi:hypothetical protein